MSQDVHVIIVSQRSWVEILRTSSLYCLLRMRSQLLEHPVIVGLRDVSVPRFPFSHHLPRNSALRRLRDRVYHPPVEVTPDFAH